MKLKAFGFLFFALIFTVFGYFIQKNISVILDTFNTTFSNLTSYLLYSIILVILSYFLIAYSFKLILKIFNIKRNILESIKLQLSALAINILLPVMGFSSLAIFAEDAEEHNDSRAAEVAASLLFMIGDYTGISIILLFSNIYLATINSLNWITLIPSIIFWALTSTMYVVLWLSRKRREFIVKKIQKLFTWIAYIANKFIKKEINPKQLSVRLVDEFAKASEKISTDRKHWYEVIGFLLTSHSIRLLILFLIFLSFGLDAQIVNVLVGYAIGITISVLSPTPMGIGFVEGAMGLAYINLGLPGSIVGATILIYRAIVFWIPFFIGFILMQSKRLKKIKEEIEEMES